MPNVLITGGAGFIGSHLAERMLRDGHNVTILDDFSTGRPDNLRHIESDPRLTVIRESVSNAMAVDRAVAAADKVFHLAAAVGVQLVVEEPVRTIHTTIHGTEVVLDAANQHKKPVLITSSSEVYGK